MAASDSLSTKRKKFIAIVTGFSLVVGYVYGYSHDGKGLQWAMTFGIVVGVFSFVGIWLATFSKN